MSLLRPLLSPLARLFCCRHQYYATLQLPGCRRRGHLAVIGAIIAGFAYACFAAYAAAKVYALRHYIGIIPLISPIASLTVITPPYYVRH